MTVMADLPTPPEPITTNLISVGIFKVGKEDLSLDKGVREVIKEEKCTNRAGGRRNLAFSWWNGARWCAAPVSFPRARTFELTVN